MSDVRPTVSGADGRDDAPLVSRRRGVVGESALLAGLAAKEIGRRPGAWVATLLTGAMFAGLLLLVGSVSGFAQGRAEDRSFRVAVGGDVEGAAVLVDRLDAADRLALRPEEDPVDAVLQREAAVGLVLPEGADEAIEAGRPVELFVSYRATDALSFEALSSLLAEAQAVEVEVLLDGAPIEPSLTADVQAVLRDDGFRRLQMARQVGAVAALLCIGVVSSVAAVFGSASEHRSLEPLLVLPVRRRSVAAGVAAGTSPVASLQVLAGVVLVLGTAALPASSFHQRWPVLAEMIVAGALASLLLVVVACAVGALAGSLGTGTDDAVSLGDLLALPFVLVGIVMFVQQGIEASVLACAVPGLGQALVVREAVAGTLGPAQLAAAMASAGVTVVLLVVLAGRLLGDERRLLRAIR